MLQRFHAIQHFFLTHLLTKPATSVVLNSRFTHQKTNVDKLSKILRRQTSAVNVAYVLHRYSKIGEKPILIRDNGLQEIDTQTHHFKHKGVMLIEKIQEYLLEPKL